MMCLVVCNCPQSEGARIARQLVEEHLAACVNVVPGIRSVYRWKDRVWDEEEETLFIKCAEDVWPALRERLESIHPYDVPEIIRCTIQDVNAPYLEWVLENSKLL